MMKILKVCPVKIKGGDENLTYIITLHVIHLAIVTNPNRWKVAETDHVTHSNPKGIDYFEMTKMPMPIII